VPSCRVALHALDRTGPPVLGLTFVRWLRAQHPEVAVDVVAFRGGALAGVCTQLAPTTILLDPEEPWDHDDPPVDRCADLLTATGHLNEVDVTLAVSVAAGHSLPYLGDRSGAVVCWAVEQGEDLHWLDGRADLRGRTSRWLAGAPAVADELRSRLGPDTAVHVVPEFVDQRGAVEERQVAHCRGALDPTSSDLMVVGAGIATHRKAPDLFHEVAVAHDRTATGTTAWAWLGGERDPLFHRVLTEARRGPVRQFRMFGSVEDVVPWLAASDVLVHPARLDAFPLVCLHAAFAGTPVVAFSGVGGVTEMFGPAFAGAPYPDVTALAEQVERLRDPDARVDLADRQAAWAAERFSTAAAAPRLFDHLFPTVEGTA
jgi:glycosyltransferase involved in cell wall biosynthesis